MVNDYYVYLRNELSVIEDMLNEGYKIKEIKINSVVYNGDIIKRLTLTNMIWVEVLTGETLIAPLHSLDAILLIEDDEFE